MAKIFASRSPEVTPSELDHSALSRALAGECVVLLENDGALPMKAGSVALYGNGARQTVKGGTGSGDVNTRSSVNIEQGLENAGFTVVSKGWLDRQDALFAKAKQDYLDWVPQRAKEKGISDFVVTFCNPFQIPAPAQLTDMDVAAAPADSAIYVISRTSGEGADRFNKRGDYLLYAEEKAQITLLAEAYKKLTVVLNVGGVMDLSEIKAIPGVNAVLLMGQLGNMGGDVLADVLTGKVNPSGKLTDTWAKQYADYPAADTFSHNDGNIDDEYYTEGIYVGYRWFDSFGVEPLYPFGFGRSYTSFSLGVAHVKVEGETVRVTVPVKNTGAVAGKEVVQLYVSAPAGELRKPYQSLICFGKTDELAPGESGSVELCFSARDMASYDPNRAAWVLEVGGYVLRVGADSRNTVPAAVLTLDKTTETEAVKNLFGDAGEFEELTPPEVAPVTVDELVPHLSIRAADIPTRRHVYQGARKPYATVHNGAITLADVRSGKCSVEELVAQLSVEEMAEMCVGTARGKAGVVGDSSFAVPGAAGDTSTILSASRGIRNLILADGPAGLRLQPVFKTDKEGNLLPGGNVLGDLFVPFDPKYTDENSDTYYQYCTAIPVGWSLAMSWNSALLERVGSMVGEEMEQFGVDLWLAPAMNIHRNVLCGRNFEYYSEDPVVSGRAAAAITRGVQSHPGKGTTIKHYAANSQEDNRYYTNSHIRERAIREIYLRGFEIAIRESHPASIMTSYNLINSIHTANSHDLIQAAARDEWGFNGVVMTDWHASTDQRWLLEKQDVIYPNASPTGCIYAGNDLQMPGAQEIVDYIIDSVKNGTEVGGWSITLADLQYNAANVIRAVLTATVRD
ncbi:MAG: glycoside hydrolase family 3 C-terminal domain-containing protein [Oscillospiraceae bacterium]|nr:glycoside hydrolase family 3 C-terminal domain-containing protein [Oscillospiraceae bacterium]